MDSRGKLGFAAAVLLDKRCLSQQIHQIKLTFGMQHDKIIT